MPRIVRGQPQLARTTAPAVGGEVRAFSVSGRFLCCSPNKHLDAVYLFCWRRLAAPGSSTHRFLGALVFCNRVGDLFWATRRVLPAHSWMIHNGRVYPFPTLGTSTMAMTARTTTTGEQGGIEPKSRSTICSQDKTTFSGLKALLLSHRFF